MNRAGLRPVLGLLRLRFFGLHRSIAQHLVYGAVMPWLFMATIAEFTPRQDALRLAVASAFLSACFMAMRAPAAAFAGERLRGIQALLVSTGGVTARTYIAVHALGAVALSILPFAVFIAAAVRNDVEAPYSAAWIAPMILLILILHGMGMWLARTGISLSALLLATDLAIAVLVVLCPLVYASDAIPQLLRPLVDYAPPTLGVEAVLKCWHGDESAWGPIGMLALWATGLLVLGYRGLRVG